MAYGSIKRRRSQVLKATKMVGRGHRRFAITGHVARTAASDIHGGAGYRPRHHGGSYRAVACPTADSLRAAGKKNQNLLKRCTAGFGKTPTAAIKRAVAGVLGKLR